MYSDSIDYTLTNLGNRTKAIRIVVVVDELLYDIANMAYVEGDIMRVEDEHDRHQVIDIVEDGNRDRVYRTLARAFSDIEQATYPYSKREIDQTIALSNQAETPKRYLLSLTVPDDFGENSAEHIVHLVHEYMVCAALSDWMIITKPEAMERWEMKKQDAINELRITINMRMRRVRRTMSPF